jgi:hypothetical protein
MPRPKGSKNKKTLEKQGKLSDKELKKLEEWENKRETKKADKAFFDLVERARVKGALIGEPEIVNNVRNK